MERTTGLGVGDAAKQAGGLDDVGAFNSAQMDVIRVLETASPQLEDPEDPE